MFTVSCSLSICKVLSNHRLSILLESIYLLQLAILFTKSCTGAVELQLPYLTVIIIIPIDYDTAITAAACSL